MQTYRAWRVHAESVSSGRIDFTQVESLGDLIDAETNEQRRLARMGVEVPVISLVDGKGY